MKLVTNHISNKHPFWLGVLISFFGSIPLGYLNVVGLEIMLEKGSTDTLFFISGIVIVELVVLLIVSKLAIWLVKQQNLLVFIDVFTILFFLGIAYYFYVTYNSNTNFSFAQLQLAKYPIVLGLILNSLNFMQWPYWSGIYLYLFRTNKLSSNPEDSMIFILGALIGTFIGMLAFIYLGKYIFEDIKTILSQYLNIVFTVLFLFLALFQLVQFSLKHYKLIKNL